MKTALTKGDVKKRSILDTRTSLVCGFVAFLAVISLFIHPRIQVTSLPSSREEQLRSLITSARSSQSVDPFLFWQIRDQYGSGFFTLAPDHTIFRETQELLVPPRSGWVEFATYHGKLVESHDYLTPWSDAHILSDPHLLDQLTEKDVPRDRLIVENEQTRIFYPDSNHITFAFIKPVDEMKSVYGLYNFPDSLLSQLKGRMWGNTTTFTLNCCSNLQNEIVDRQRK